MKNHTLFVIDAKLKLDICLFYQFISLLIKLIYLFINLFIEIKYQCQNIHQTVHLNVLDSGLHFI